jgi:Protein of unknown function (DUF3293)
MSSEDLKKAYKSTSYCVEAPGEVIRIRVGLHNPQFDHFLAQFVASQWAFVTAFNPRSRKLSEQENQERHETLAILLAEKGYSFFPCNGVDDDNEWPTERGYVILEVGQAEAENIAHRFEQNAILFGKSNGVPELVMLVEEDSMAAELGD